MSFWSGSKPELKRFETLSHKQKNVLSDLLKHLNIGGATAQNQPLYQQGSDYLSSILSKDPEMMKQFEAPAMRQFNEEIVPGLAERFSGMGARNSSAFGQAMGQAGSGLAERLAAMRAGLGMQASQQGFGYSQLPFQEMMQKTSLGMGTPAFGYQAFGGMPSGLSSMLGGLSGGIGTGLGSFLGSGLSHLFGF